MSINRPLIFGILIGALLCSVLLRGWVVTIGVTALIYFMSRSNQNDGEN